jgi:hypothetical protein
MKFRTATLIVVATATFCAFGDTVLAQSVSINPVADAFVASSQPNGNYGGGGALGISGLPSNTLQTLLRFDLSAAKSNFDAAYGAGNWSLGSAVLQLAGTAANNPIFNPASAGQLTASWMQNDTWEEGAGTPAAPGASGITLTSLPTFLSASDQNLGTFSFDGSTSATATYSLSVGSGLAGDTAAGGPASIRLSAASGDVAVSAVFNSRSFGTASRRPLLTLSAVAIPEPSTCILFVCAAIGLAITALRAPRA